MQVSVIVPVYNDFRIKQCIYSLLTQRFPKNQFEIIIVDNNSNTSIQNIIRQYPVKYVREKNQGSYFARNKGISLAKGRIIAFTDADCVADPAWLYFTVKAFKDRTVQGVGGRIRKIANTSFQKYSDNIVVNEQRTFQYTQFLDAPFIATANAAYRKSALQKLGGFDTNFQSGGDADLAWRMHFTSMRLLTEPKAVVYHNPRTSFLKYVKQHFVYGVAQTQLFKKYRNKLSHKYFIQIVSLTDLFRLCHALVNNRFRKTENKRNILRAILTLVRYAAFVSGNVYGCVRNKVIFLKLKITTA